jgi:dimethylglycine N-methyltransferase
MSSGTPSAAANVAADYYDSADADRFYAEVWGGEDIHIGLYSDATEPIAAASRRTVDTLMALAGAPPKGGTVVDLGSGYGGASRLMASTFDVSVQAINISAVENQRHRALNAEAGLAERITVHDASFEAVPLADASADLIWSQDAILHSGDRALVLREVARLLKPGGVFVLTDPMAADGVEMALLQPILDRIHLPDLASPERYRLWAEAAGLQREVWQERTEMLVCHYARVRDELRSRHDALVSSISAGYLSRMDTGLGHWVEGGEAGRLSWGLMRFSKPL